ncbi:Thioredoxin domain-containing protein 3 [Podochytrium sp. JEL0797]|nr:Thioredoxin domain-containing protein 3 [Podochytrium sp. JEL0797]
MSKKPQEIAVTSLVTTDDEFLAIVQKPGVAAKFAGPCEPMLPIFKKNKVDFGEKVTFVQAQNDHISCLETYRDKSCPEFLVIINRILVGTVRGANAPLIERLIKMHIDLEDREQPHQEVELTEKTLPVIAFISPNIQSVIDDHPIEFEEESAPARESTSSRRVSILERVKSTGEVPSDQLPVEGAEDDGGVESTLAMLKPDAMRPSVIEEVLGLLYHHRFQVLGIKKVWLNKEQARELYKECEHMEYFERLVDYISCAPVLAIELSKTNCIEAWRKLVGPRDPQDARLDHPRSLRALYGQDRLMNSFHASDGPISAERELSFFFKTAADTFTTFSFNAPDAATLQTGGSSYNGLPQKTLCVIKPNAILKAEQIITKLLRRGFEIVKREEVFLPLERAQELSVEFLDTPDFEKSVDKLMKGPALCLALKSENAIESFMEMLGPTDPSTAKTLYPMSLHALYGISISENGLHGSPNLDMAIQQLHSFFPHYLTKNVSMGSIFKTPAGSIRASISNLANESTRASVTTLRKEAMRAKSVAALFEKVKSVAMLPNVERTLALIKPDVYPDRKDRIVDRIKKEGFVIVKEKELVLDRHITEQFYQEHVGKPYFSDMVDWMSSAPVYVMVIERIGAVTAWRQLCGTTDSERAREESPQSLRAQLGTDKMHNAVHASESLSSAAREIGFIFGSEVSHEPAIEQTLALIKPDAYPLRKNDILRKIDSGGFTIARQAELQISKKKAEEFYKEHAGKEFYDELTTWMSSAAILALILEKPAAIVEWRNLAGPTNSNTARDQAPYSIRAQFGTDGSMNAVHGSDSVESAQREIQVVFGDIFAAERAELQRSKDALEKIQMEEEEKLRAEQELLNAPPPLPTDTVEPAEQIIQPMEELLPPSGDPKIPRPPSSALGKMTPKTKSSKINVGEGGKGPSRSPSAANLRTPSPQNIQSAGSRRGSLRPDSGVEDVIGLKPATSTGSKRASTQNLGEGLKAESKSGSRRASAMNVREHAPGM